LAFDQASDQIFDKLGLGETQIAQRQASLFVVDLYVKYLKEVVAGDVLNITSSLLEFDSKALVIRHQMYDDENGTLVAVNELLCLNVDMLTRQTRNFDREEYIKLQSVRVSSLGRSSHVKRKIFLKPTVSH
jgi:acyl-CoA thioester hydrolase